MSQDEAEAHASFEGMKPRNHEPDDYWDPTYNAYLTIQRISASHIDRDQTSSYRNLPDQIPLQQLINLPPPFSKLSSTGAFDSHLESMTSLAFLTEGEWIGSSLCTYGPASRPTLIRGIYFRHGGTHRDVQTRARLSVHASGTDSALGSFTLVGVVYRHSGTLVLEAEYGSKGWAWAWRGVITPLGIAGKWIRPYHDNGELTFWLWKRDWVGSGRSALDDVWDGDDFAAESAYETQPESDDDGSWASEDGGWG